MVEWYEHDSRVHLEGQRGENSSKTVLGTSRLVELNRCVCKTIYLQLLRQLCSVRMCIFLVGRCSVLRWAS